MGSAAFIAGDWGTSNLRLFLCDAGGQALDRAEGTGVAQAGGDFAGELGRRSGAWTRQHGDLPVLLCGMIGSDIGWSRAPYVPCPASLAQLADSALVLEGGRVRIVPGLQCRNRLGAPDFLRGEETQLLGALRLAPELARGRQLLCLPGTHTKWAVLDHGRIEEFLTAPTGELFAILRDHSVLVGKPAANAAAADAARALGMQRARLSPPADLLHLLFETRSRRLAGEMDAAGSAEFLSGLLVASDVRGALAALGPAPVTLVGAPVLARAYGAALALEGVTATTIDGATASLAGLTALYAQLVEAIHRDA